MPSYAPTFVDVQTIVFDKTRLDSTDDLTRVKNAINNAMNNVAVETKYISGSSTGSALAAADQQEALPSSLIELEYITCNYGGQTLLLGQVTFDRLLALRQQPSVAGPPIAHALRGSNVELWPPSVGGEILTYYGPQLPNALSADADTLPFPEPYGSNLLAYGAAQELSEFNKDVMLAQTFAAKYADWMARFRIFIDRRQGALPKHMIVDDGTHYFTPHDLSSDWDLIGPRPFNP